MESILLGMTTPMQHSDKPWQRFWQQLSGAQQSYLESLRPLAQQRPPSTLVRWSCGEHFLGYLPPQRAAQLVESLAHCHWHGAQLVWDAFDGTCAQRSAALQLWLAQQHAQGLLTGWRNECFSFWDSACQNPDPQVPPFLSVERAGFRYLGMMSHAVHINGFLPDGRVWCGRRSLSKATDPGRLDNVAAGGLPSGELILDCAVRELAEEAGLASVVPNHLVGAGWVRTSRQEPEGWHDETLHVFNLLLDADFQPRNQDGEVAEFVCLTPSQLLERARAGAFTWDAMATLWQGVSAFIRAPAPPKTLQSSGR